MKPLHTVLMEMEEEGEGKMKEFTSWGLYSVIQGLEHLHMGGKVHGNFGIHSIFVNKCGDWKLFGLDWCSPLDTPLVAMNDGKMEVRAGRRGCEIPVRKGGGGWRGCFSDGL